MTDRELQELAASVEELKKAVTKNNPLLRGIMKDRGWVPLTVLAGIGMTLFCLPAQVLVVAYGSFEAIPAYYRAALWCILALVLVLSGVWKVVLLARRANEMDRSAGIAAALTVFFRGPSLHIGIPYILTIGTLGAFAVFSGHPWYVVPAIAVPTCFWANFMATLIDRPAFKASGWWCLITGLSSVFFIEQAPFIWLFIVFGGLCFLFAGAMIVEMRREKAEGR